VPRPAVVCRWLLEALNASEGRRQRRRRDTTPDAIGMAIKRRLLSDAAREDPDPEQFEGWLLMRVSAASAEGVAEGSVRAMALAVLSEWQLALVSDAFRDWLAAGAPSADQLPADSPSADVSSAASSGSR
jgi:hypothetical protein